MAADSLAAVDAPPVSHMLNLAAAADAGVDADQIRGVLAAITPIIGTPRVAEPALTQAKGASRRSADRARRHRAPEPTLLLSFLVGRRAAPLEAPVDERPCKPPTRPR